LSLYASQGFVLVAGIAMVPIYIQILGAEAYGLIGFFSVLQSWFQILDLGLTPTMARESARMKGGALHPLEYRHVLRVLEAVFVVVAIAAVSGIASISPWIATHWLHVQTIPIGDVTTSIALMGGIISLRWISGLYRGAITGLDGIVWLSGANVAIASFRFVFVVPYLAATRGGIVSFFGYQLLVALAELFVLFAHTYSLLPRTTGEEMGLSNVTRIRRLLKLSLTIAAAASLWVAVTQLDKLLLSSLLPLSEYAIFSLAITLANGVLLITGPIAAALMPRLTRLWAEGDERGFIGVYETSTQLVSILVIAAATVLALFPGEVLTAWTGNSSLAVAASPIVASYAVGNAVLSLSAFAYYLQYARGELKLHVIGMTSFALVLLPAVIWSTVTYGARGAGMVWLSVNALYFLFWVPLVHRKFFGPAMHRRWLCRDIIGISLPTLGVGFLFKLGMPWPNDRVLIGACVLMVSLILVLAGAAASKRARDHVISRFSAQKV
jgi:O-antigen/teichoic acid export membrane protein